MRSFLCGSGSDRALTSASGGIACTRSASTGANSCPSSAQSASGCATDADLLSNFAGLRFRSAQSGTARPAFVNTRYSGLTGHHDRQHGDDAGLAAGELRVSRLRRSRPCLRVRASIWPLTSELPGGCSEVTRASAPTQLARRKGVRNGRRECCSIGRPQFCFWHSATVRRGASTPLA
jgi:hypothetical protein